MPTSYSIRISLVNAQGQPLGGTVDFEFVPLSVPTGPPITIRGVDASKDVDIGVLQRVPVGQYRLTIRPTDGTFQPVSQTVTISDSGTAPIRIVIQKQDPGIAVPRNSLKGTLAFDNGLPAGGITTRAYHVGFGGQEVKLGEVVSDAGGAYLIQYAPPAPPVNLQVRVVDSKGAEVTISATKYGANTSETLNLVVPASVKPLASEFVRLSADLAKSIGDITRLGQAQESGDRQDLTLLRRSTNWDARLVALAATAVQQAAITGVGQEVLYGLYRVGLPSDPALLATVPSSTVQEALKKASEAGIVQLDERQIAAAVTAVQNCASKTLLASVASGAVSTFQDLLSPMFKDNPTQQAAFAGLFFSQASTDGDFWAKAAALNIPAATIDSLRLQGKFLYLTSNNAPLAQRLQQTIGTAANLDRLVGQDFHKPETWQATLVSLAGTGGDKALNALIPSFYSGTPAERAAAYAGDLARKVRMSFPGQVAARMIETRELAVDQASAPAVTSFLRKAAPLGYGLGRTPLNRFLKSSGGNLPALNQAATRQVKTLHRLYQITPSMESLQSAMQLGFTSAYDIAKYPQEEFLAKYESAFPAREALIVYRQARTVSSVTFNAFAAAKAMENAPPVYGFSATSADLQRAKDSLVQQFPSMATLFGNLDFCQCQDCRSVLSPAAYFVDVLDLLGEQSAPNPAGYTPLDVLIGKDAAVPGRRPDLGALPLTCENTNSAMPYIDLVNEIFEYYIANSTLDAGAAYDTGSAATADLIAEPQHILPNVYSTTLKQAVYPLNLPFDLWIETVRGFLSYFKIPFEKLLDAFRQANTLELFAGPPATPYFRSQILAESLAISPTEYAVFTSSGPANWFHLYGGYANEAAAINDLKSAKTLSQRLGVSYQELTDLVQTGFLNPGLYPLIFQFERFNIDIADAFGFTNQPGFPALTAQQAAVFGAKLDKITASYLQQNASSTFNARTWLGTILPANYSRKVLMLADPNSGCDFSATTLQYADGSPVTPLDLMKFNLFVRLWKKLGWTLEEVDLALQAFFPSNVPVWTDPGFAAAFGAAWKTALVYLAHLEDLNTRLAPDLGRTALLPFWTNLPAQGPDPLFSRLFLTAGVLNNDPALDDPNGNFPCPASDLSPELRPLSAHAAAVQGVLGLTAAEITAILADAAVASPAAFSMANLSICYRYSLLAKCLDIPVADLVALRVMSGLHPFQALSGTSITAQAGDVLSNQTIEFVTQVSAVEDSGFTVEDLKYLLRHQFDPVGKYQSDPNALILLIQSAAAGLAQIRTQNAVPVDLMSQAESLIDQRLSGLVPAAILKTLFGHLTNSQTYTASQGGVAAAIDPTPFSQETSLAFQYDAVTQTQSVSFKGLLADWKKTRLEAINATPLFAGLLDAVQKQAHDALAASINDILGVWASLVQYEAVETPVAPAAAISDPLQKLSADPALTFSYDQSDQLQWLGYRGVLTDQKLNVLTTLNNSATLAGLLAKVQQQALPAYNEMTGSMLAMWTNGQSYVATASPVTPAGQVDTAVFTAALAQAQQNGTIVDPVPPIQFAYDSAAQVQTLTCQGDLTDSMRAQLSALIPSAVLSNLLQTVRNQAVQLFQSLAAGLLTVGAADLDNYSKPFLAVDAARQQRLAKAGLVKVFSPLLARKLSRQFVLQTLSASLASDPSLTEALVTDAALLDDPSKPGQSLLNAFLAVGQPGVSATYYGSPDQSGAAIASGTAATTDTSDPSNSAAGMRSCRFEGYLQVPIDGPYRFFAELGNTNAQVAFRLDSPDPASLLPNPVIQQIAARDGDEASRFLQLKGGVAYHFTLDFKTLGAGGSSLLIQGENLPKGPLSQIQLYAQAAVDGFSRARILLAKVLQILEGTSIGERELSYLVANSSQFSNLRLSSLPTRASDDSAANAVALFAQFRTLTDYADLRKGPAGGTDGLIDVFQAASRSSPPAPASAVLANLTRRDAATVADVATALGPEPLFANNVGVRRVWDALQLVQILGLPVTAVSAATAIVNAAPANPDLIAANFKNAVKAQYTPGQWRPIAKSVFDVLRRRKRDALVSYLVNLLGLQNSNQLFEYFLIDPGMEPVVQTSRLRLAMSSLQTFVQRCLLNLENGNTAHPARNVAPSAIRADWWDWMKRYRVWQANREIFLFPENWMEPELRLDKTDLFQALESDLLQGDVTRDLVEDSFLTYLKGLDVRARLDIVATFLEQDLVNPGLSTLHVLGRTYGHPHKYFYRTYEDGTWSGWEAVTLDIEGDHVALAVWRGRLNVFWLTFVTKTQAPPSPGAKGGGAVSSLDFGTLTTDIFTATPQKLIQVQLHWSEHLQGKWTNRISSDVEKSELIAVHDNFDPRSVHVHVSKEVDSQGNEGAVRIHLDFPDVYEREYLQAIKFAVSQVMIARKFSPETASVDLAALASIQRANHAFRVTSKNCNPDFRSDYWQPPQSHPYNTTGVDATFYTGSSNLVASFQSQIQSDGSSSTEHESILNSTNHYQILTCANTVVPPFLDPSDPLLSDAGGLVAPVFFKDASNPSAGAASPFRDERTFYVQPSLTETVIEQWDGWAVSLVPAEFLAGPGILKQINVVAQVPESPIPVDPGDPVYSLNSIRNVVDWATDPATAITYGNVLVGKAGGIGTAEANVAAAAGTAATPGISVIGREGLGLRQLQSIQRSLRETLGIPLVRGNR